MGILTNARGLMQIYAPGTAWAIRPGVARRSAMALVGMFGNSMPNELHTRLWHVETVGLRHFVCTNQSIFCALFVESALFSVALSFDGIQEEVQGFVIRKRVVTKRAHEL